MVEGGVSMSLEIDFSKIGQRIKDARKAENMTQEQLATACGCASNHLSGVENGANRPSLELIIKIATVLNSSIDYFLMDSPCASTRYLIDSRIAPKLEACSDPELQFIEKTIDDLLTYRAAIRENI